MKRLKGPKNNSTSGHSRGLTPTIIFINTDDSQQTELDKKTIIRVLPDDSFTFKNASLSEVRNTKYFDGARNHLKMSRTYRIDFLCEYNMALYPFDTQTCSMNFEQSEVSWF